MITITKGITCVSKYSDSVEHPEILYLNVYFAFLISKLFNLPFYLNHEYLDRINLNKLNQDTAEAWKKIFNYFLFHALPLSQSDMLLLVNYNDLPNHYGLSSQVMVTIDLKDSYEIFLENYDVFAARVPMVLGPSFKAYNLFEPERNFFSPEKINIAIDLMPSSPLESPSLQGLQSHAFDKNSEARADNWHQLEIHDNKNGDLIKYSNLINQLVNIISSQTDKDLEIHLFSAGDRSLFKELLVRFGSKYKINLHLNIPISEVFFFLSMSNYLVCANSALSWLATLVNTNPSFIRFPFQYVTAPTTHFFVDGLSLFKDQFVQDAMAKNIWSPRPSS